MEDAIYGGRIDNAFDLRVLRAYLRHASAFYCQLTREIELTLRFVFVNASPQYVFLRRTCIRSVCERGNLAGYTIENATNTRPKVVPENHWQCMLRLIAFCLLTDERHNWSP